MIGTGLGGRGAEGCAEPTDAEPGGQAPSIRVRQTAGMERDPAAEEDGLALERVRRICGGLAGTEEAELQSRPLFRVGRRRFAIFNGLASPPRPRWNSSGRSLHFLAEPLEIDALRRDGRFTPSPHHGDRGWMALRLDRADVDWDEIAELLESAHRQVSPGPRPRTSCARTSAGDIATATSKDGDPHADGSGDSEDERGDHDVDAGGTGTEAGGKPPGEKCVLAACLHVAQGP